MSSSDMTEAENVPDTFLAPVTVSFNLPDYSRLDRPSHAGPSRPERPPEVKIMTVNKLSEIFFCIKACYKAREGLKNIYSGEFSTVEVVNPFHQIYFFNLPFNQLQMA